MKDWYFYIALMTNGVAGAPVRITPANAWYLNDEGHLCIIDATGRNFIDMTPTTTGLEAVTARIFPPAWISNTELVFGARNPYINGTCWNTPMLISRWISHSWFASRSSQ